MHAAGKEKGRWWPALSYSTHTLRKRYATALYGVAWPALLGHALLSRDMPQVLVRRLGRRGGAADQRRHTGHRCVVGAADGERDIRPVEAEVGQFTIGHADKLGFRGAQPEIGPDGLNQALEGRPCGHASLGSCVSPGRRSFAGQIL